ncbi:MAG TPA: hypothetical protein VLL52_09020 [Anaerolineae bacterium]|nr:hypothetical protein [Anaerolineae bacterium]
MMGARHRAREVWKFLGALGARCHAVTLGRAQRRGEAGIGAGGRGGGMREVM